MKELEIIKFLKQHPDDWEDILKKPPYGFLIKKQNGLVLFKYTLWNSDFSVPLVSECRGIILEENTWKPVLYRFDKFWNYDEENSAKDIIDWSSAKVQTKIDGSIIGIAWYNNHWIISTNSMIDADEVTAVSPKIEEGTERVTFGQLFREAAARQKLDWNILDKNKTYIFELTSKYNEQVVHYDGIQIWHIGTRNMNTLKEENVDIGIQKPKEWPLTCLNDCIKIAQNFKEEQEGFVVVDANYNRIKIKSPYYFLKSHELNDDVSLKKLVDIFLSGDYEEFISYFPKYKGIINRLEDKLNTESEVLEMQWTIFSHCEDCSKMNKFEFYNYVKDKNIYFNYFMKRFEGVIETKDGKPYTAREHILRQICLRQQLIDYLRKK